MLSYSNREFFKFYKKENNNCVLFQYFSYKQDKL